ncbi:MAG: hypothetical protein QM774_09335 [Gordonia sp. (in: high G+C Gram-positive bacteria)]|uniref:Rv0361 family membrane protein n=1 Tax=Gordonia sp. (in: high G+C Gram-positive bacteria) TaxID=84139 RepID=UPI0039E5FD2B
MTDDKTPDERVEDLIEPDGRIDNDPEPKTWRDAMPFFLAFGFVAILVLVISLVAIFWPPADRLNDSTLVQHAVNDQYTARNSLDYSQYRASTCEKDLQAPDFPTEKQFDDDNRAARNSQGALVVPKMDVDIQGDVAHVTVHEHRDDASKETTTDLTVRKQGDEWKVCK